MKDLRRMTPLSLGLLSRIMGILLEFHSMICCIPASRMSMLRTEILLTYRLEEYSENSTSKEYFLPDSKKSRK